MPIWPADAAAVARAAQAIAAGQTVAFPTETVYGLGARADDARAVAAVFARKGRPADHPLIVHLAGAEGAAHFAASLGEDARRLMAAAWPGPLTLIVARRDGVAAAAAGGHPTIGLRVPSHPVAQALLRAAGALGVAGVAAPSANRFGRVSPTTAAHVHAAFADDLVVLDGGPCAVGIESAIVDCSGAEPALLRPGSLGADVLERWLGRPLAAARRDAPRAPGTLQSHYAPGVPLRLWPLQRLREALVRARLADTAATVRSVAVYSRSPWNRLTATPDATLPGSTTGAPLPAGWQHRRMPDAAAAAAQELFAVLREVDAAGVDEIWVEAPPPDTAWDGVRDRLQRAAS